MKSFLPAFKRMAEMCADKFELVGDVLVVEVLPPEMPTTKSGIVLAGGTKKQIDGLEMNLPVFCRVLAKGAGYYEIDKDGDRKDVELEVEPGDIILVGPMAVKRLSAFGPLFSTTERQIALTREQEIQLRFKGEAAYRACIESLADEVDNHVVG